jgi:hypothetical protein
MAPCLNGAETRTCLWKQALAKIRGCDTHSADQPAFGIDSLPAAPMAIPVSKQVALLPQLVTFNMDFI